MRNTAWFKLNRREAGSQLLRQNDTMIRMQNDIAQRIMSQARAQFLTEFGFEGSFQIDQSTRVRTSIRLAAADARTSATLKRFPGWLGQFTTNLVV
jgi:hypothetical protein